MITRLFLIVPILFISFMNVAAQDFYRRGLIITMSNDTIQGLINDKENLRSPSSIEFKENAEAIPKTYQWSELKGFATSRGVYFESHHFQYDAEAPASIESQSLPKGFFTTRSSQQNGTTGCFIEVIAKGKFSLYKYYDVNDRIHFLILDEGKTGPEELLYRPFKTPGSTTLMVNESYKQQLSVRSEGKCNSLKAQLNNLPYRERNLSGFVSALNTCYGNAQKLPVVSASDRKRSKVGLVGEAYLTSPGFFTTGKGYDAVQFGGGISYEVFSRKRPHKLSFYSELKFKNFSDVDHYRAKFAYYSANGRLTFQTIKLTNMVRVYPLNVKTVFMNAGVVYGFRYNTRMDGVTITDRDAADRFEFGFSVGAGKKFSTVGLAIEPRFELNIPNRQKSIALVLCKQF